MTELSINACSQTPVTALIVHNGLILSGQGPFLRVYDYQTSNLEASAQIYEGQSIHGFEALGISDLRSVILVWGGCLLRVISLTQYSKGKVSRNSRVTLDLYKIIRAQDWILDVAFRPSTVLVEGERAVLAILVTAHNALFSVSSDKPWPWEGDTENQILIEPLLPGRRCILYSAHVKWISKSEVLVASGTAFGEIIVWSCSTARSQPFVQFYFSFTGHDGSIFGVRISDIINSPFNTSLRLLTSCSDDRTVRIWDISKVDQLSDHLSISENVDLQVQDQQTGFPAVLADEDVHATNSQCLAVSMGHVSRIWSVRYVYTDLHGSDESIVNILSVGEDATCQTWGLFSEAIRRPGETAKSNYILNHLSTAAHHPGKNIWSIAVSQASLVSGHAMVVTGGADGRIVSRMLDPLNKKEKSWEERDIPVTPHEVNNIVPYPKGVDIKYTKRIHRAKADYFRSYAFVDKDSFILTTNNGLVLLPIFNTLEIDNLSPKWHQVTSLDDLKGYSVVSSLPGSGLAFLAGANGSLYCFDSQTGEVTFLAHTEHKIAALYPQYLKPSTADDIMVLVTHMGDFFPRIFRLHRSLSGVLAVMKDEFPQVDELLGVAKFSQTSSALVSTMSGEIIIFLGYRDGQINTILKSKHGTITARPVSAHGKEAVTAMYWVESNTVNQQDQTGSAFGTGWLFSVGRDGTCAVHEMRTHLLELTQVHKLTLPFGPNIEGICVTSSANDVYVYGFNGKHFVVYSLSTSDFILSVECGGAHRVWTFDSQIYTDGVLTGGNLVWTKASKLNSCSVLNPGHKVIQNGGHGREIKACAISAASNGPLGPLIATGAEDTDIRLFQIGTGISGSNLSCASVLRKHVTGIQSVEWSADAKYLFSCGGYEEFFIWRVRPVPGVKIGIVFESACPIDTKRSDLRIMGFAINEVKIRQIKEMGSYKLETESTTFEIAMVYSNSVIKTWRYATNDKLWTLLATGRYTSACLTQVTYILHEKKTILMSVATDGHFAFWAKSQASSEQIPQEITCLGTQALHQSSIKSLSICTLNEITSLVLTGGDDNGLGLTLIRFATLTELQFSSLIIPRAHAAGVTATSVLTSHHIEERDSHFRVRIVTASNDQRVKLWDIEVDLTKVGVEGVEVKSVANRYTAVADVSSMALFPGSKTKVLICGVGMEVWDMEVY